MRIIQLFEINGFDTLLYKISNTNVFVQRSLRCDLLPSDYAI